VQWSSLLTIDEEKNQGREVVNLLHSTESSWLHSGSNVNPDMDAYPEFGFPVSGEREARTLAVSVKGSFDSYFRDRPSPFEGEELPVAPGPSATTPEIPEEPRPVLGTIDTSPESSRLVVVGSSEFLDDVVLDISRSVSQDRYLYNLQFLENAVDWAVEDEDLLSIRSRGTYARLLADMNAQEQTFWEGLNYAVALLGLIALGVMWNLRQRGEEPIELVSTE
jgi:ABC-2 type transport system permease protein